jgi:hypothetical protein
MRLRKTLGVTTQFPLVTSRGQVSISYNCSRDKVEISADISGLETKDCKEVLLLNEQGASIFRKFTDSEGRKFFDTAISGWSKVLAKDATFFDIHNRVSFSLENKEGATMYYGREQIKDRFSWSGITYSFSPTEKRFEYSLRTNSS